MCHTSILVFFLYIHSLNYSIMAQFILNISDEKKAFKMFEFLQTLNYIQIEELTEENVPILESEKTRMRNRRDSAEDTDFKNWDNMKRKFDIR